MFFVYALRSANRNYIYVGMSSNVSRRLNEHNKGFNKTTKPYAPFILIFQEEFDTRINARKREIYLKSGIGKEYIKSLIS
jgi:putative endonuclease